jgi:predicted nucleic acid-binding protein
MIVADASWVIALRDPDDEHHAAALAINDATGADEVLLHPVTFAQCLVAPATMGVLEQAAEALRAAYDIAIVDDDAPVRWARLRADTGLRLPDVIVLDTALVHGAEAIVTFDDRLGAAADARGIARARTERAPAG